MPRTPQNPRPLLPAEPHPAAIHVGRIPQLDALRGIAAFTVFTAHCALLYPTQPTAFRWLARTPAFFLLDGRPAVLLFFLLSGFVLYLPYTRGEQAPYGAFLVRRLCRIYLPYLAAVAVSAACCQIFAPYLPPIPIQYTWHRLAGPQLLREAALFVSFILPFNMNVWNSALWSLAEEMRVSIVFPLIAMLIERCGWKATLAAVASALVASSVLVSITHHFFPAMTLDYAAIFACGALLAKYRSRLAQAFRVRRAKWLLLPLALTLMYCSLGLERHASMYGPRLQASDAAVTAANALVLIAALQSRRLRNVLSVYPVQLLGKVSYSFYLFHLPVLFALLCLLWQKASLIAICILAILVTTALATLSYRWIELPSIALGRKLTGSRLRMAKEPA